jgi:outer membrane receptor protein involved in Fe transport
MMARLRIFLTLGQLCAILVFAPVAAGAQTATATPTGAIQGTVTDLSGSPVANVRLSLDGPAKAETTSDGHGIYAFSNLPPGIYVLSVSKAGYISLTRTDIAVLGGSPLPINLQLQGLSLNSLTEIGHVTVTRSGSINISPQAITVVPGSVFTDQGQVVLTQALNEIPGYSGTLDPSGAVVGGLNNASQSLGQVPQLRGALPYESASLIDGHPVSLGSIGFYNPRFISPYILDAVEVAKGPGSTPANVTSAIGGTINYITLQPTSRLKYSADWGPEYYGGSASNFRITGTTLNSKLGFAADVALNSSPGPFNNTLEPVGYIPNYFGGATINGQNCLGSCGRAFGAPPAGWGDGFTETSTIMACCFSINTASFIRNELYKLRYNFSPSTSLTTSYVATQANLNEGGNYTYSMPNQIFAPPAGYSGSFQAGPIACCWTAWLPYEENNFQYLFTADFKTSLTQSTSLQARYYRMNIYDDQFQLPQQPFTTTVALYGGVDLGTSTTPTIFDGQQAVVSMPARYFPDAERDSLGGYTIETDTQAGENLYTLSLDQVATASSNICDDAGTIFINLPPGSGQTFTTVRARAQLQLNSKTSLTLSDYFFTYTNHYSPDVGKTFQNATQSFNIPRMALTYRPTPSTALRASMGASVAPPYLSLISSSGGILTEGTFYQETLNNGDVKPETAWGYDVGGDARLNNGLIVSADAYLTNLRNMFFSGVSPDGTYGTTPQLPLYLITTENIATARFDGVELSAKYNPPKGFGFTVQGNLQRDYVYNLPANFYTAAGGTAESANLAVIPNVNFDGNSASDTAGIGNGRQPYAQGYGQLEYRIPNRFFGLLGVQYYGSNNPYNVPAFATMNASLRYYVARNASVQFSVQNLTGAYNGRYSEWFGGMPIPFVNGQQGVTTLFTQGPTTWRLNLHVEK